MPGKYKGPGMFQNQPGRHCVWSGVGDEVREVGIEEGEQIMQ